MPRRTSPRATLALPAPSALADALEAEGFRAALSVQREDGDALSGRDQRTIERILRAFAQGHGSTELSDHEISRVVAAYLDGAPRRVKASGPANRIKRATALRATAARMGRGQKEGGGRGVGTAKQS